MFRMRDEKGSDDKVLAVPSEDPRIVARELADVPPHLLLEIRHFFETYKDLEPGKSVAGATWVDRAEAEAEIERSRVRLAAAGH